MSSVPLLPLHDVASDMGDFASSEDDLEFSQRPLEGVLKSVLHNPRPIISRQQCLISTCFTTSLALVISFLGAYLAFFVFYPTTCSVKGHAPPPTTTPNHVTHLTLVQPNSIATNFRNITSSSRPTGSGQSERCAEFVAEQFAQNGIQEIQVTSYKTTIWRPSASPNTVTYVDTRGNEVNFQVIHRPLYSAEESGPSTLHPFAAHSPAGLTKGNLVYANYGRSEDFAWLRSRNVAVEGSVIIARVGKIVAAAIVMNAEKHGAKGLLLFCDPAQCAAEGLEHVYPDGTWLPSFGVKSLTARMAPGSSPVKVTVQPISYEKAEQLLATLTDLEPPADWTGALRRANYRVRSPNPKQTVTLDVKNQLVNATVQNVIGIIEGVERDRYVLIGSSRDSWTFGGFGSGSGTAALLEATRVLGHLAKTGWRPRRTLMFCSWDAGDYNSLGAAHWAQKNQLMLSEKAVAYINLDALVRGNVSLAAQGSFLLQNLVREASKAIPNPDPAELRANRSTVFDTWLHNTCCNSTLPEIQLPQVDTESSVFENFLGIPTLRFFYSDNETEHPALEHPLHSTVYDTFHAVTRLDPEFKFHGAMVQLLCQVAWKIADDAILPLDVHEFAMQARNQFQDLRQHYRQVLTYNGISIENLERAVENFTEAAHEFQHRLKSLDLNNLLDVRMVNDQLATVQKSFLTGEVANISPSFFRYALYAPSELRDYRTTGFASLVDSLGPSSQISSEQKDRIEQHVSELRRCFETASSVLDSRWL